MWNSSMKPQSINILREACSIWSGPREKSSNWKLSTLNSEAFGTGVFLQNETNKKKRQNRWQLTSIKQRISSSRFKLWNIGKDQTTCTNPDELRNWGFSVSTKRHLINSSMALGILLNWENENTTNGLKFSTCILNISVHSARAFYGTHCLHVRYILHIPHELFTLHTSTSNFNLPSTPFTRPNLKIFKTAFSILYFQFNGVCISFMHRQPELFSYRWHIGKSPSKVLENKERNQA